MVGARRCDDVGCLYLCFVAPPHRNFKACARLRAASEAAYPALKFGDAFGASVAVARKTDRALDLVVGAPGDDAGGDDAGAIYALRVRAGPTGDGFLTDGAPYRATEFRKVSADDPRFSNLVVAGANFGAAAAAANVSLCSRWSNLGSACVAVGVPGGGARRKRGSSRGGGLVVVTALALDKSWADPEPLKLSGLFDGRLVVQRRAGDFRRSDISRGSLRAGRPRRRRRRRRFWTERRVV